MKITKCRFPKCKAEPKDKYCSHCLWNDKKWEDIKKSLEYDYLILIKKLKAQDSFFVCINNESKKFRQEKIKGMIGRKLEPIEREALKLWGKKKLIHN